MNDSIQAVWPAATGITDLPEGVDLSVAEMRRVEAEWAARREEARDRPELAQFTRELSREWAIETGQIENLYEIERGVTLTLIAQGFEAAVIPHGATDKDPEYVLNLLRDQQSALEFLFDVVGTNRELSEGFVKELHALMTAHQPTTEATTPDGQRVEVELRRGEYKTHPNSPSRNGTVYTYCPPEQVASEMGRLVAMHGEHEARGVAPEVSAAWLHHRFTQIHPFQDGNGRIARALASLVLIRAGLLPLVVPVDQKSGYLEALERADGGDLKPLVFLVARRQQIAFRNANRSIIKIAPDSKTPEEAAERLALMLSNREGADGAKLNRRAREFSHAIVSRITNRLRDVSRTLENAFPSVSGSGFLSTAVGVTEEGIQSRIGECSMGLERPERPFHGHSWYGQTFFRENLLLNTYCIRNDVNDGYDCVAFVASHSDKDQQAFSESLVWTSDANESSLSEMVVDWTEAILVFYLDRIRRRL